MAIMFNNRQIAQPQLGISKADIIYEAPVEGGITRMMAVFQDVSDVGVIGSVRSARHYYLDLAQAHDAVYIHAGGSPQAYSAISSRGITNLDGVNGSRTQIFYRDAQRRQTMGYEHSMVTSGELLSQYLPTYTNMRLEHSPDYKCALTFTDDGTPSGGADASEFTVNVSGSKTTSFAYSPDDGVYHVSQYKKAYADGNDGSQLSVTNVIVVRASVSRIAGDSEGRLNIDLTGDGTGYFACGGKYIEIDWKKDGALSQFAFTRKDGTPLTLGRGRTYICIIPQGTELEVS
jgi:hypothetical protein